MYIAIEGPKGSGKTTLVKNLKVFLTEKNIQFEILNITKKQEGFSLCEYLFDAFERLNIHFKLLKLYVYKNRAKFNTENCDFTKPIVVSDRSVLTDLASRITDADAAKKACSNYISSTIQSKIPAPDILLFLDFDVQKCHLRTLNRTKSECKKDGTIKKIRKSKWAFKKLIKQKGLIGLEQTKVINLKESDFPLSPEQIIKILEIEV